MIRFIYLLKIYFVKFFLNSNRSFFIFDFNYFMKQMERSDTLILGTSNFSSL